MATYFGKCRTTRSCGLHMVPGGVSQTGLPPPVDGTSTDTQSGALAPDFFPDLLTARAGCAIVVRFKDETRLFRRGRFQGHDFCSSSSALRALWSSYRHGRGRGEGGQKFPGSFDQSP